MSVAVRLRGVGLSGKAVQERRVLRRGAWLFGSRRYLVLLLATLMAPVFSQTVPDGGQESRLQEERERERREQLEQHPEIRAPKAEVDKTRLPENETPCIPVQRIVFVTETAPKATGAATPSTPTVPQTSDTLSEANVLGNGVGSVDTPPVEDPPDFNFLTDKLAGADGDDPPGNRCLGNNGLTIIQKRAQEALFNAGYVTSRVIMRQQDLSDGILKLSVIPGYIRDIIISEPEAESELTAHPKRGHWFNALPTSPGNLLNLRDIEQGLENFQRVPTAQADIKIAAPDGESNGQSDLQIGYKQGFPFRLTLNMDDGGLKTTGRYQGSATVSWDNPLGLSDLFYVTYNHSLDQFNSGGRGTHGDTVYYSIPFGYWSLTLDTYSYDYEQNVAGANQIYRYAGYSRTTEAKLSRLLYRDSVNRLEAGIKTFSWKSNNSIDDTDITVQDRRIGGLEFSLYGKHYFDQTSLEGNIYWKQGFGIFGSKTAPEEAFGEGTSKMEILNLDATLKVPFKWLGQSFRYNGYWRYQTAYTPLIPQQRFALGNRYTVRGFDGELQLVADRGWLLRNDIGIMLPEFWSAASTELYLGIDRGEVGGRNSDQLIGRKLTGGVIGLRGNFTSKVQYDVFVGAPLEKPAGFTTANPVGGFNLIVSF